MTPAEKHRALIDDLQRAHALRRQEEAAAFRGFLGYMALAVACALLALALVVWG